MLCSFSQLDNPRLEAIQALENDLGKMLLSFSCYPIESEEIDDQELSKISEFGNKIGRCVSCR